MLEELTAVMKPPVEADDAEETDSDADDPASAENADSDSDADTADAETQNAQASGRWVFLPNSGEDDVDKISSSNGRWLYMPLDALQDSSEDEAGEWVFVPFGNAAATREASSTTGTWIRLKKDIVEAVKSGNTQMLTLDKPEAEVREIPDYLLNPNMEMPTKVTGGNSYIGTLEIPKLSLKLPIMSKWDYDKLKIAPCRYCGSAYLDNMVLCAHNYSRHFGRLKNLPIGSLIIFTDVDGNVFKYETVQLETLKPSAVMDMRTGDWDLTLFTCTIGGATRVTTRCVRVE